MTIRWGIWGPGRQARNVAPEFALAQGAELVAVGSRTQQHADDFAAEFALTGAYGSLAELAASDVDAVFVASPHGNHVAECVELARAGKHLIVEKSMATTPDGTREIIEAARANRIFCMEGMWTRFLPPIVEARRLVEQGEIGFVHAVQGDLHAYREFAPADRLFNPQLGGGALLDLGVYVVAFAVDFLGVPTSVRATGHRLPNGVEGAAALQLSDLDGRTASLSVSFETYGPGRMAIMGTQGWIDIPPRFHHPSSLVVHRADGTAEQITPEIRGKGFCYEIEEASRCIAQGLDESPTMTLGDSLAVSKILAKAAEQID